MFTRMLAFEADCSALNLWYRYSCTRVLLTKLKIKIVSSCDLIVVSRLNERFHWPDSDMISICDWICIKLGPVNLQSSNGHG